MKVIYPRGRSEESEEDKYKTEKNQRDGNGSCLRVLAGRPRIGNWPMTGIGSLASTGQAN